LINSRTESILSRLTKPARGAGWVLGVFAPEGELLDFAVSSYQIDRRRAFDMLGTVPLPLAAASVTLKITGDDGKVANTLSASTTFDDAGRSLAVVLVRPQTTDGAWLKVSQNLKNATVHIAAAIAADSIPSIEGRRPSAPPLNEECAFFLLTEQLQVVASQPQNPHSSELAKIVAPRDGRLPVLLERTVRRLTKSWDFSRVESCIARTVFPIPGTALCVGPMSGSGGVMIGVFLKREVDRHPAADAAAAYRLSPREREVLHALLDGRSVADIAAMLDLAESTVTDHVARLIVKTNAHNRVEMAALLLGWPALRSQFTSASPRGNNTVTDSLPNSGSTNGESLRRVSWRYKIRSH
jgi:DNA-binding CsgD family transcriptional regulator